MVTVAPEVEAVTVEAPEVVTEAVTEVVLEEVPGEALEEENLAAAETAAF